MSGALITVGECARRLAVSECWVRRHLCTLPVVRLGRAVRIDGEKLAIQVERNQVKSLTAGASSKPESENFLMVRRYQRGSVYKVGKQIKVWYGMYRTDQLKLDGSIVRKQRMLRLGTLAELPTKHAAMEALRKVMGANLKPSTQMRFYELVERWKAVQVPTMKASTAQHYQNALRQIGPVFDQSEITAIKRHDVERFMQDRARVYSRATLRSLRTALSLVLGYAVANSWLEKNPVSGVKLPRPENCGGREITRSALTPVQVTEFVGSLAEPYATLVLLLSTTGLRIGECAALRWTDLVGDVLHVSRRIYCGAIDDLKTKGSRRKLPIAPEIANRLRGLRTTDQDSWIFQASNGSPLNPGNWLRREIKPAAQKLGLTLTGWHDFRHFFSTQLRRSGTHPKLVSTLLGHARVNLALDVYDHVEIAELIAPVARVGQMLGDVRSLAVSG